MKNSTRPLIKCATLLALGSLFGTGHRAGATPYAWTGGAGNWTDTARWTGGATYPQAGDTATFGVAGVAVSIGTGSQTADAVEVTGTGAWTWSGETLSVGTGGFNYGSSGTSTLNAPLAGAGALTITAGRLNLGGINNFSGGLEIRNGIVGFANDNVLGSAGAIITFGGPGSFGILLKTGGATDLLVARPLVLEGAGGKLSSPAWQTINATGVISGSGRLVLSTSRGLLIGNTADSTFSGGTSVQVNDVAGARVTTNFRAFGTGDVVIESGNYLYLFGANNMAPTASVRIRSTLKRPGILSLNSDFAVPKIHPESSGGIVFNGTSGANINALFAADAPPLGDGRISIGSSASTATFTGTSLKPGTDGVYRIYALGGAFSLRRDGISGAGRAGVLTGGYSVDVHANYITFDNPNDFTGTLTILPGSQVVGSCMTAAGTSPFGSPSGGIVLNRASPFRGLTINSASGGVPVEKASLTFHSSSLLELSGAHTMAFEVGTLTRGPHATLKINGNNNLGKSARFTVLSNAPASSNNMVAPHFVVTTGHQDANMFFAEYKNGSFTSVTETATSLAGATSSSVVNLGATEPVPSGGKTVHALKTAHAVTGTETLTIGSGGLILSGSAITHTAPLNFGTATGVVWTTANNTWNGKISGTGGLIKAGGGGSGGVSLTLGAANDFSGVVAVNEGQLRISNDNNLGDPGNKVYLNNGGLVLAAGGQIIPLFATTAIVTSREYILGSNGGGFGGTAGWTLNGKITGEGILWIDGNTTKYINSEANDYTGGTFIEGGTLEVGSNGRLGTGDVAVVPYNASVTLRLKGVDNVHSNAHVTLRLDPVGNAVKAELQAATHTFGSLEGSAPIILGTAGQTALLKVGFNHRSTEFYGDISEAAAQRGQLTKLGTGSLTLWGYNTYRGATTVEKGTLYVNGMLQSPTTVSGAESALGGTGVISNDVALAGGTLLGGTTAATGTLRIQGTLSMDADSTLAVRADTQNEVSRVDVSGDVTLAGTLDVSYSGEYEPQIGDSFVVLTATGTIGGGFQSVPDGASATIQGNQVVLGYLPRGTILTIR